MCYKHVLLFLINTITDFPVTKYSLTAWKKYRASISAGNKKQLPPLLAIQNCRKNQFGLMVHILWHAHRHMHPGTVVQQRCRDFFRMFSVVEFFSVAVLRHLIIYFICEHKHLMLLCTYFTGKSDQLDHLKSAKAYQHFFPPVN